jgi:hypothetical protein
MPFAFNPISGQIIFAQTVEEITQTGSIELADGDLSIDSGSRDNESSIIDQGERV